MNKKIEELLKKEELLKIELDKAKERQAIRAKENQEAQDIQSRIDQLQKELNEIEPEDKLSPESNAFIDKLIREAEKKTKEEKTDYFEEPFIHFCIGCGKCKGVTRQIGDIQYFG